jgi:quercetin dioxygenase-like cupin family protein
MSNQRHRVRQGRLQPPTSPARCSGTRSPRRRGPSKTNATTVTFVPAARTVWHKHNMRQVLVVTAGVGIIQIKGQPPQAMRPGDVATVQPGVEHWHGASANSLFAHISILESKPEGTDWGTPVSEGDYRSANAQIAGQSLASARRVVTVSATTVSAKANTTNPNEVIERLLKEAGHTSVVTSTIMSVPHRPLRLPLAEPHDLRWSSH